MVNHVKEDFNKLTDASRARIVEEKNFLAYFESNKEQFSGREFSLFNDYGALYKLIFSVYAIYEYTIKELSVRTLEELDDKPLNELIISIQMLSFKQQLTDFRKKVREKFDEYTLVKNLTELHIKIKNAGTFSSKKKMIDTHSNLNFETLTEIIEIFGLDKRSYQKYYIYVETLLTYRNKVAHGNMKELTEINIRERVDGNFLIIASEKENNKLTYEQLCAEMVKLIEQFRDDLIDFLEEKKYLLT